MVGATVVFTISGGSASGTAVVTVINGTTDGNGDAIIHVTNLNLGTVSFTAKASGTPITNGSPATVTFVIGAPAPSNPLTQLITDVQNIARKRGIKTLTFLLQLHDNRGIAQAKSWGFEEFRIMPDAGRMLAFFRKSVD